MAGVVKTLDYRFSEKHLLYMQRALLSVMNVAEGAVRAGKTVDNIFVFAALLDISPDRVHLATGSTAGIAKMNLGDCNGLGLEWIFRGRCRWGKCKGMDALFVKTPRGERVVLFTGGVNADSYKRIRGLSIGMWIATEINLHHPTMIREAFSRQLAAKDRRIFWDLNPEAPGAPIYRDYLDVYAKKQVSGVLPEHFYNYAHFTIFDNATISEERLAEILSQYEEGSIWYQRDIAGERCAAEGMIYPAFASEPEKYMLDREAMPQFAFLTVGVDFGGNRSKTAFVACGFVPGFRALYVLAEERLTGTVGEIDAETLKEAAERFLMRLSKLYTDVPVRYMFCDSEEQYLIAGIRKHLRMKGFSVGVRNARKLPIHERISCMVSLLASGRFFLARDCELVAAGLTGAVWDQSRGGDVRLDNFSSDIDILDALEYAFEGYIQKFV